MSRIVHYCYHHEPGFDETAMEKVLAKAKKARTIEQYDTGRGNIVWFEGRPGKAMRTLRLEVRQLLMARSVPAQAQVPEHVNHCGICSKPKFYHWQLLEPHEWCQCESTKRAREAFGRLMS